MKLSNILKIASCATALTAASVFSATSAQAQQVFTTDVVVQGSLCVGIDCVSGESFGFDTVRLKENNLRIHFQDTSASASFPSNDWRIVVNDSSNGGTNHFSIEDSTAGRSPFRVEAGASANALVVEADSDIGIGTLDPVVELHVVDGNTPTLRLEQNGSDGFTPQTFDLASNEANFFIRDVTNGSQLPFRVFPGADTDAFRVENNNTITTKSSGSAKLKLDGGMADWELVSRNSDGEFALNDLSTTGADFVFKTADSAGNIAWEIVHRADDGLGINTASSLGADFVLSNSGDLTVLGTITSSGPTCGSGCDAVFDADYPLPTIAEHKEEMYALGHLPTVGPTGPDIPVNLTEHVGNMLNELEKAHIFIAQINEKQKSLEAENAMLRERLQKIEMSVQK